MEKFWEIVKDGKNFALIVTTTVTVGGGLWSLVQAQAELKVKKEYDKILVDYAIQLAKCE